MLPSLPRRQALAWLWLCLAWLWLAPRPATAEIRRFDIPALGAVAAVKLFSAQSGQSIVAPTDVLAEIRTQAIQGQFTPAEALRRMFAGTGLVFLEDARNGTFALRRSPSGPPPAAIPTPPDSSPPVSTHPMSSSPFLSRVATVLALFAGSAQAQNSTAPADEVLRLTEFTVTSSSDRGYRASNSVSATRVNTPIGDLPLTVQAFTSEFIADLGATSILDIARFSPGVSSEATTFTGGNNQTTVRGFANNPFRNGFRAISGNFAEAYNVERVEVVKGPSSLLYGQISPGGLVNYLTKTPRAETFTKLRVAAASWSLYRAEVDANIRPAAGVGLRVNGLQQENELWVQGHKEKRTGLTPTFEWQLAPGVKLNLGYEYYRIHEDRPMSPPINGPLADGSIGSGPYVLLPRDFSFSANSDWRDTQLHNYDAALTAQVAGFDVRVAALWVERHTRHFQTGQANGRRTATAGIPNQLTSFVGTTQWRRVRDDDNVNDDRSLQADIARTWKIGPLELRAVIGAEDGETSLRQVVHQASNAQTLPDWDLGNPATWNRNNLVTDPSQLALLNSSNLNKLEYDGVYALTFASLWDGRVHALAGIRRSSAKAVNRNLIANTTSGFDVAEDSPQAGLMVKVTRDVGVYASASRSFVPQSGTRIVNDIPVGALPPIIGKGWETGIKTRLLDGRVSTSVAYFSIEDVGRYQNVFTPDPVTGQNRFTSIEAGVQQSRGIEAEGTFSLVDGWQLYVGYAHIDAKISRNLANPALVGSLLPAVPRDTFNALTKYTFQSGPVQGLSLGTGINYTSTKLARVENLSLFLPSYTLLNVFATYEWKVGRQTWLARAAVANLTDEDYQESTYLRGSPRRYEASLEWKF